MRAKPSTSGQAKEKSTDMAPESCESPSSSRPNLSGRREGRSWSVAPAELFGRCIRNIVGFREDHILRVDVEKEHEHSSGPHAQGCRNHPLEQ